MKESKLYLGIDNHMNTEKTIHDPIHGNITLSGLILQFVDTKEFQRLRNIRQLGCCYYVYPGATHARFEHSIGVHHLCGIMLSTLQAKQPELHITNRQIELLKIAGLMHDVGHGCFSHAFDDLFIASAAPVKGKNTFLSLCHEQRSCRIVETMIDKYSIPVTKQEVKFIQSIIDPPPQASNFIYQILANKLNGLDCDKFDYIQRDAYNLGIQGNTINFQRIIDGARVIDGVICYPYKDMFTISELYRARYRLHRQVYTHHTVQQVELMITDCLKASGIIDLDMTLDGFIDLDDTILTRIHHHTYMAEDGPTHESTHESRSLQDSKVLLKRLNTRNLYQLVGEIYQQCHYTSADIVDFDTTLTLTTQDIIIKHMKIGYTGKDINPLDHIRFYTGKNPNESFSVTNNLVVGNMNGLLPTMFEECICRVFCKDPCKLHDAKIAFHKMIQLSTQSSNISTNIKSVNE